MCVLGIIVTPDWVMAGLTGVLVLLTLAYVIVAISQVKTARNTERAWIIVNPTERAPEIGFVPEPGDPPDALGRDRPNYFAFSIKNTGNTPARLIEAAASYRIVARLEDVPPEPSYPPKISYNEMILVKDDSLGMVAFLEPNRIVTSSQARAVRNKEQFWYAYGIVVYKDAFGHEHETRFGYVYFFPLGGDPRPLGFVREGLPPAYNRAT